MYMGVNARENYRGLIILLGFRYASTQPTGCSIADGYKNPDCPGFRNIGNFTFRSYWPLDYNVLPPNAAPDTHRDKRATLIAWDTPYRFDKSHDPTEKKISIVQHLNLDNGITPRKVIEFKKANEPEYLPALCALRHDKNNPPTGES
jgi:hypothetical protein